MREAYERAREGGLLEDIPGTGVPARLAHGLPEYLINTGVQRLVQDLDELPLPFDAMGLFEPPHRRLTLSSRPVAAERIGRHAKFLAMVTTHGCQFHCAYCPIPGYNQFTFRNRSPERLVEEMSGIALHCGISGFFGTDDNLLPTTARPLKQSLRRWLWAKWAGGRSATPSGSALRLPNSTSSKTRISYPWLAMRACAASG